MLPLRILTDLCSTRSGLLMKNSSEIDEKFTIVLVFQQSIRTAKVFKPNLLISKHRSLKVKDGQWVEKDSVLTLQNNLVLYPGENVLCSSFFFSFISISIFFSFRHLLQMITQFDRKFPVSS